MNMHVEAPQYERGIFCNRTLNLRNIKAIGYDMDYTLVHYHVEEWEKRAYQAIKQKMLEMGWPVEKLEFDPNLISRGLIIDTQLGNLAKADRFGFVRKALHGVKALEFEGLKNAYAQETIDLADKRWVFLNTLFSLSEGCMYAQLVDLLDARKLPEVLGYEQLYRRVNSALNAAHMEGDLKQAIVSNPDRFVVRDPETPLALLDQKYSGKKLMLVTNSEWSYTVSMMEYAFNPFLPDKMTWRDLFDVVIVSARKPDFFTSNSPFFEIVTQDGLLKPSDAGTLSGLKPGIPYLGGSALQLEKSLGLSADDILYVGDHMFGDVRVSKNVLRWRTALILRELEEDLKSTAGFLDKEKKLSVLMAEKRQFEVKICATRLQLQRIKAGYWPQIPASLVEKDLHAELGLLRQKLQNLDHQIAPLARASSELSHPTWGLLMRTGNDKSHLARQVERYADVYTSRVSNFLLASPFVYMRAPRGSLPHDLSLERIEEH